MSDLRYIWIVFYSESNYEMQTNVRAFSSEFAAVSYIEKEKELNPQTAKYLDWEMVAAEIDLRDY